MKVFLDACRMAGPLRLAVEAPGEPLPGVRLLHQPFALVGRDQRADVPLEHRLVSRRHAYFQVVEGHLFWIDLESRHGVEGGGGHRKSGWLAMGETMRIGPYEIRRVIGDGSSRSAKPSGPPPQPIPLVAKSYGADAWPEVALEFLNGPSRSAVWPMNRVVSLIGSAVGCKFRLADSSVSPFHCSLVRTSVGVWVVDLLGGDGVAVNNAVVRHASLADGDVLRIGRYQIRIQIRNQARERPPITALSLPDPPRLAALAAREIGSPPALNWPGLPAFAPGSAVAVEGSARAELMPASSGAEEGRISESVLVPLVNQFGIMQQQMLDQFQNAMGMLVGMFGSLQREQMDLIRQELDQLRDVTREFQELKLELAALSREQARPAAPLEPSAPKAPDSAPAAKARSRDPGLAAAVEPSGEKPPRRPGADQEAAADGDVMLWLNQRIVTLQEERESRWRKILKLLPNAS